jgi:hypothetical protein
VHDVLTPRGHDRAGTRVSRVVRVCVGVGRVVGAEALAPGPAPASGPAIARVAGSRPRGRVPVSSLTHLGAGAEVPVAGALHLTRGQGAARGLETRGRGCRRLVQVRVVHGARAR